VPLVKAGKVKALGVAARTRTRLLLPQEFRALVSASDVFDTVGAYSDFDLSQPFDRETLSWRMVSVLKRR